MDNKIILTFNFFNNASFDDIFNYCNRFSDTSKKIVQKNINNVVKYNWLNNNYSLTKEGKYILDQLNIYYQRIIVNLYRKYKIKFFKNYQLKEIRLEQQKLRNYLISNCSDMCKFCEKKLPFFLLETAHIKPRYLLNYYDKQDCNNVIFLCRLCHVLFDQGYLSVFNNELLISNKLNILEYDLPIYEKNKYFSKEQQFFFDFHYKFIFKK